MTPADIAIAGCGPGGLSAALFLHRQGHRVTVFERFDVPQPLGSGLIIQPTGLAVLDALGLGGQLKALAAPLDGLHGISVTSQRVALAMDYAALGEERTGFGTHRALLFQLLYDAVQGARIAVETGREIVGSELLSGGQRRLRFADGSVSPAFDLVINAMGARSPLSRRSPELKFGALWATLDWINHPALMPRHLDQRYHRAGLMAGIMPIGRAKASAKPSVAYFWSLKGSDHSGWQSGGLDRWRDDALALWPESRPIVDQITEPGQFVFARYQHRTMPSAFETGLAHLGDAWHATSPQLGQGANMALLDAAALAHALSESRSVSESLKLYARSRRWHIKLYQALSFIFTPAYQSDGRLLPLLRDQTVSRFAHWRLVRQLIARTVAGHVLRPLPPAALGGLHATPVPLPRMP